MAPFSRTRQSGGLTPLQMDYTLTSNGPPTVNSGGTLLTGGYAGTWKIMHDVVTPGWNPGARKKLGWVNNPASLSHLVTTPCYSSTVSSNTPNNGYVLTRGWHGDALGYVIGPLIAGPAWENLNRDVYPDIASLDFARNKALIECRSRIAPPSSQSLVTAMELPKTVDLILSTAKKLVEARRRAVRLDVPGLRKMFGEPPKRYPKYPEKTVLWDDHSGTVLMRRKGSGDRPTYKFMRVPLTANRLSKMDEATRLWLEYRYGWAPLVYDLVDQLKAFHAEARRIEKSSSGGTGDYAVYKAFGSGKHSATATYPHTRSSFGGGSYTWNLDVKHDCEVRAYAYYRVMATGLISRLNDFGAFDVPRAIWELVPFSFVVDWFVPIGDWLASLTPKFGVEILVSGYREHDRKEVIRTLTGYTPDGAGPGQWPSSPVGIGSSDGATNTQWNRHPHLPFPTFPTIEVKLGLKRLADAAALFMRMR